MDGVLAHLHERGWSEIKVGCCYHTHSRVERKRPERLEVRAQSASYLTALEQAQSFGWRLWQEALRRGVLSSEEVVVLGDGAHWIWNIAERHFPQAIQIVDWYHASEYVWQAASAIWGQANPERSNWAHGQLDALFIAIGLSEITSAHDGVRVYHHQLHLVDETTFRPNAAERYKIHEQTSCLSENTADRKRRCTSSEEPTRGDRAR
jgi:hypothetical protein